MALWGKQDNLVGGDFTPAAPTNVTIVGTASSEFWTADAGGGTFVGVATGTTLILGAQGVGGFVTIESLLSPSLARVGKMSGVGTDQGPSGTPYAVTYSEQPITLKNDPGYAPSSADGSLGRTQRPVGVNSTALQVGAATTQYGGIHAGWVGVTTYIDMHNNLRVKQETFVAMSGIQTGNRDYPMT